MDLRQYKIIWVNIFCYYNRDVNDQMLLMYSEDTSMISAEQLNKSFQIWRRNNSRFPMPADLLNIARPKVSNEDAAKEIAMRVNKAVSKFGHMRGIDAKLWLGDEGWRIVEGFGGWNYLCENLGTNIKSNMFIAQARDYVGAFKNINQVKKFEQISNSKKVQTLTEQMAARLNEKQT